MKFIYIHFGSHKGSYEDVYYIIPTIALAIGKQRFKGHNAIYIKWLRHYIKIVF